METTEIRITGLDELERNLKDFPTRIAKNIVARTVYAGAAVVRNEARALCPVKTGALRRSIRIRRRKTPRGSIEVIYTVGPGLWYGRLVEYGTKAHKIKPRFKKAIKIGEVLGEWASHPGATPRPYLRPAFDGSTSRIIDAMRAKLKAGIDAEYAKR